MTLPTGRPSHSVTPIAVPRPFADLRDSGLLWLINAAVFHPRGFALALRLDATGHAIGWTLRGDGSEPWYFTDHSDDRFLAAEATFAAHRAANAPQEGPTP